jgi:hypothetical protein
MYRVSELVVCQKSHNGINRDTEKKEVEGGVVGGKEGAWRGFAVKATNRRRADCKVRMTDAPHTRRDSS